jgi:MFS family permease
MPNEQEFLLICGVSVLIMLPDHVSKLPRRRIRIAVSVFFFLAGLCFSSWASRIPAIQQKLSMNNAALGGILFALPVGLMVSLPVSGWMVARFGSRRIMIVAAILYGSLLPILGIAASAWQLAGTLFFFGFAGNLLNISMNTQAVGTEVIYGRSIMASFHGLWSLAGFTGATFGTFMISQNISPFFHFCIICVAIIIAVAVMHRYALPEDLNRDSTQPIFVKPDRFLLKLGLIAFCCMICEGTMFDWSGVYFSKQVHAPKELSTLGYVAFMSTMASGRFMGDWLAGKLGKTRMIELSGLVIAVGLLLAVIFPYVVTATIGFLFVGLGVSSVVPLVYGTAGKSKRMSPGMALAAVSTIGYFGFLFGPPLIGFIAQASSLRWSFSIIALLGFSTTLIALQTKMEDGSMP